MDGRAEPTLDQFAALSDLRQRHTFARQDFHATRDATRCAAAEKYPR